MPWVPVSHLFETCIDLTLKISFWQ
uniref:Uncharacterized protein n=1 Tax=Arundo donax TaxID=35708 RepID=A0A0A8XU30_ARUDO